jgi:hypothetical protein
MVIRFVTLEKMPCIVTSEPVTIWDSFQWTVPKWLLRVRETLNWIIWMRHENENCFVCWSHFNITVTATRALDYTVSIVYLNTCVSSYGSGNLFDVVYLVLFALSSGLESREYGRKDSSRWLRLSLSLYPQKLELTSPTIGCLPVGIVRSRTQATEFSLSLVLLFLQITC